MGKVLYISEQGCVIRKARGRILVTKGASVLLSVPAARISNVLIFGMAQISTQAAHALLEVGADIAFLTRNGRVKGILCAEMSKNAIVRAAQYRRSGEPSFRLRLSRAIVKGKLSNQRTLVLRFQRRRGADFAAILATLEHGLVEAERAETLESLGGIEGSCTRAYFSVFGQMVGGVAQWEGRTRHPPKDPANALLSLGYVLLTNELGSLLAGMSLDPYVGFLHGLRYGRMSLALDLAEEFRHGLVDVLTLNLLRRGSLRESDFVAGPEGAVMLTDEALRSYFAFYEARLTDTLSSPLTGKSTTWRGLFREQAEALRDAILQGADYRPYVVR